MPDIELMKRESRVFEVPAAFSKRATIASMEAYDSLCAEAEKDHEGFWARLARSKLFLSKPFSEVLDDSNARPLVAKNAGLSLLVQRSHAPIIVNFDHPPDRNARPNRR